MEGDDEHGEGGHAPVHAPTRRRRIGGWIAAGLLTLCALTFLLEEDWLWGVVWTLAAVLVTSEVAWPSRSATPLQRLLRARRR